MSSFRSRTVRVISGSPGDLRGVVARTDSLPQADQQGSIGGTRRPEPPTPEARAPEKVHVLDVFRQEDTDLILLRVIVGNSSASQLALLQHSVCKDVSRGTVLLSSSIVQGTVDLLPRYNGGEKAPDDECGGEKAPDDEYLSRTILSIQDGVGALADVIKRFAKTTLGLQTEEKDVNDVKLAVSNADRALDAVLSLEGEYLVVAQGAADALRGVARQLADDICTIDSRAIEDARNFCADADRLALDIEATKDPLGALLAEKVPVVIISGATVAQTSQHPMEEDVSEAAMFLGGAVRSERTHPGRQVIASAVGRHSWVESVSLPRKRQGRFMTVLVVTGRVTRLRHPKPHGNEPMARL